MHIQGVSRPQGPKQTNLPHTGELPDNSDESDFDPEQPAPTSVPSGNPDDIQPEPDTGSDSDEEPIVPAPAELPLPTTRSTRVRRAPVTFKPQARQSSYNRYNHDESFRMIRNALVNTKVRQFFPGYGTFNGTITSYYPITDTYHILFEDGDDGTDSSTSKSTSKALPSTNKHTTWR